MARIKFPLSREELAERMQYWLDVSRGPDDFCHSMHSDFMGNFIESMIMPYPPDYAYKLEDDSEIEHAHEETQAIQLRDGRYSYPTCEMCM